MRPSRWRHLRYLALGLFAGVVLLIPTDAGALSEPDRVTCEGYAEKRVYLENQSWVSPQPDNGSGHPGIGHQGHIHVATCFPLHQDVTSEILELDIRIQLHNVPGRPYRLQLSTYRMGGASGQILIKNPVPRCETTDCDQWVHVEFPLGDVTESGWTDFGIWLWVDMEDGRHDSWYNVNRWAFNLVNGAPPRTVSPGPHHPLIGGDTWLNWPEGARTNYSKAEIAVEDFPWNFTTGEFIPVSGLWEPHVNFDYSNPAKQIFRTGMAMIDPKLHAVPTDHGTMVYDGTGGIQQLSIDTTQLSDGPHRLLLASCDPRPDGVTHCGVQVVPFHVDNSINSFVDDDGHLFENAIEWLAARGITQGCNPPTNNRFCPNDEVTRGQMATFLVRALTLPAYNGPDRFRDDNGHIFEGAIERLAQAGITLGCNPPANNRFCPDDEVTRGQMAAFLVRAFDSPAFNGPDRFRDDNGSVFEGAIERLAQAGITLGCNPPSNNRFCPGDFVTRGQMAAFLKRAFGG